mmetsp:Transcript_166621/g.535070  ORF Transcript_166621/g.535070 Transcript_166621/m.535070 type:complete len:254 (-) Transcript_166621:197-958(-)
MPAIATMDCSVDTSMYQYWGSLGHSGLTLLESVTGGVDWKMPLDALHTIHWFWLLIFIGFLLSTLFAILNLVTAAFCQGAVEGKLYDRDQTINDLLSDKRIHLHKATDLFQNMFSGIDADSTGEISFEEFREHIQDDAVQALLALLELSDADLKVLFQILDTDGSNRLNAREFISGCMRLKGGARSIDLARLHYENQRISEQIIKLLRKMGTEISDIRHFYAQESPPLVGQSKPPSARGSGPVKGARSCPAMS